MTDQQLFDTAYRIATATFLTKEFTFNELVIIYCTDYLSESFEHLEETECSNKIHNLANSIYDALKQTKDHHAN